MLGVLFSGNEDKDKLMQLFYEHIFIIFTKYAGALVSSKDRLKLILPIPSHKGYLWDITFLNLHPMVARSQVNLPKELCFLQQV